MTVNPGGDPSLSHKKIRSMVWRSACARRVNLEESGGDGVICSSAVYHDCLNPEKTKGRYLRLSSGYRQR